MAAREPLQQITDFSLQSLETATAAYETNRFLAGDWLERRGISEEVAATFRVGVVADPHPGHERMAGWLAIPYLGRSLTGESQVRSIRFRCIQDHSCKEAKHGKYQTLPGDAARMFNTRAVHHARDEIHITEGEMDTMILAQCGLHSVAIPGANAWKDHYPRVLAGFNRVFVWGDPDDAGKNFSALVARSIGRAARVVHLSPGSGDVNDTYLAGGKAAILELLERS